MKVCTTCGAEWPDDLRFCPNDGSTLRSAGAADLVGSVIAGRYHIEKKLGEGGMGAVYLGEHVKMGRKSAIKVMAQSLASDPEAIARFNREAANAARINHPNVCAIYDFGETEDGLIYLAMEFIEGESLSDLLHREGALPPRRAATILQQTADALQAAHDLGIVHRDLKPDNIMITRSRDGGDLVKVVDFGIAKAMGGGEGQKVTKTGLVVGTPEYMSPEQLAGDVLDGRSDIYSLALVFFRMMTGTLPFQADTAQEVMIKRLTDEPLTLSQALPAGDVPAELDAVLDRALQRLRAERYASATQFARDVVAAVERMPAPAGVDQEGATELLDSAAVATTAGLPRTRVAGAAEAATPTTPAPRVSPVARPARKAPVVAIAASLAVLAVAGGAAVVLLRTGAGPAPAPPDTGSVTEGTAPAASGGDPGIERQTPTASGETRGEGSSPSAPQERTTTGTTTATADRATDEAAPTTVDSAAIDAELGRLLELIIDTPAEVPTARVQLRKIYDNSAVPAVLRARGAAFLGQSYHNEDRMDDACGWYRLASQLDPGNTRYRDVLTKARCTL